MDLIPQEKDKDTALISFWKTTTMYNESVLMISRNGELPKAALLFTPDKILSVRNAALNIDYKEGTDWEYKEGQLRLLKGSKANSRKLLDSHNLTDFASGKYLKYRVKGRVQFRLTNVWTERYSLSPDAGFSGIFFDLPEKIDNLPGQLGKSKGGIFNFNWNNYFFIPKTGLL